MPLIKLTFVISVGLAVLKSVEKIDISWTIAFAPFWGTILVMVMYVNLRVINHYTNRRLEMSKHKRRKT